MPRVKIADYSKALTSLVIAFALITSVVGAIAFLDSRYTGAAETRQLQGSINEILLSQLYAERRDILRIPPHLRTQRDKDRLELLNDKIRKLGGQ